MLQKTKQNKKTIENHFKIFWSKGKVLTPSFSVNWLFPFTLILLLLWSLFPPVVTHGATKPWTAISVRVFVWSWETPVKFTAPAAITEITIFHSLTVFSSFFFLLLFGLVRFTLEWDSYCLFFCLFFGAFFNAWHNHHHFVSSVHV